MKKFNKMVALTGGIGCGKSTALKIFNELGCLIIDSDEICHQLYDEPDKLFESKILTRWGDKILVNNKVNRKNIAEIVFSDEKELQWLNSIIHPIVFKKGQEIADNNKDKLIIFDIPLLFETGMHTNFRKTIAIWSHKNVQIERLKKRNWNIDHINKRLKAQLSEDIKLELSDYGIINSGDIEYLKLQCKQLKINIEKEI
ncbi:MAG TPA: dephospho-CoA kinase [Victivallales bacterium]|nr:dephospho-CoA kinase [Victivallales bacterium]